MKAVLASHNKKKIVEMERLLKLRIPDITLVSPEEAGETKGERRGNASFCIG